MRTFKNIDSSFAFCKFNFELSILCTCKQIRRHVKWPKEKKNIIRYHGKKKNLQVIPMKDEKEKPSLGLKIEILYTVFDRKQ